MGGGRIGCRTVKFLRRSSRPVFFLLRWSFFRRDAAPSVRSTPPAGDLSIGRWNWGGEWSALTGMGKLSPQQCVTHRDGPRAKLLPGFALPKGEHWLGRWQGQQKGPAFRLRPPLFGLGKKNGRKAWRVQVPS